MKTTTTKLEDGYSSSAPDQGQNEVGGDEWADFQVPAVVHLLGGLVHRHRRFWLWLARLEALQLADQLARVALGAPIFVCGLARSGSTLLHEVISSHPCVASHRIKDYPMIFTPCWWRRAMARLPAQAPHERPHRDGIVISAESPDSIEEMLWMAFFPDCHNPYVCNLLGADDRYPAFESFYKAHLRKLLLAENASRYAAKANYHVARLGYLVRLFPDAKFVIPIRSPAAHIASLVRQHRHFSAGQRQQPRGLAFMQRSGHFEFGLDRRPLNLGDTPRVRQITEVWKSGEEILGQAMYWDMVYGYLARLLASDPRVRAASLVVRFEDLCDAPLKWLRSVFEHCQLPDADSLVERHSRAVRYPAYYDTSYSPDEAELIRRETSATASLWGY